MTFLNQTVCGAQRHSRQITQHHDLSQRQERRFHLLGLLNRKYTNAVASWCLEDIFHGIPSPLLPDLRMYCMKKHVHTYIGFLPGFLLNLRFSLQRKFWSTPRPCTRKVLWYFNEITWTVTHSDKHMREGSSGVFRHIDGRNDPISLLSPQPVGSGASLMSLRKLDNSGLGVPDSWQHFFNANLKKRGKIYLMILHLAVNNLHMLSFDESFFAMTGWKMNLYLSAVKWQVFPSPKIETKILDVTQTINPFWKSDRSKWNMSKIFSLVMLLHCISWGLWRDTWACPSPRLVPKKARPPPGYMAGFCPQRCFALSAFLLIHRADCFPPAHPCPLCPWRRQNRVGHSALAEAYHLIEQALIRRRAKKVTRLWWLVFLYTPVYGQLCSSLF